MRMTAAVLYEQGLPAPYAASMPFRIEEVELDGPGEGEVLVEIRGAGLCHSDLSVVAARAGWPDRAEAHFADAARLHESLGADGWLARTRLEWGRFLLDPGRARTGTRACWCRRATLATERGAADVAAAAVVTARPLTRYPCPGEPPATS